MTQADALFRYLRENYEENEPIFLSEINILEMKSSCVRPQMKKLTQDGRVKRFDAGIYYIPRKSFFRSGSALSVDAVLRKKYLIEGEERCGYVGGLLFANRLGLTTQVPAVYEVSTNKATTSYRETKLGSFRVIVKRPYTTITSQNVDVLQFLDLMREVTEISELEGAELTQKLIGYMKVKGIGFDAFAPYLSYYPEKIFKNMYEVGLLNGIFA